MLYLVVGQGCSTGGTPVNKVVPSIHNPLTAGNAGKIKVRSLAAMQQAYDAGELAPTLN